VCKFVTKWAILAALSLGVSGGQTGPGKPQEPESIGPFFYQDSATQTLKRLPSEAYTRHSGGFLTYSDVVKVAGAASPFRISASDKTAFIFKVFKDVVAGKAELFQFTVKGQEREYDLVLKSKHGDSETNRGLAVNVSKFGESSYKLTPDVALGPGEYALTTGELVFTFGVDSPGK